MPTGASAERTLAHEALGDLCWGDDDHWPSAPARLWERSTGRVESPRGALYTVVAALPPEAPTTRSSSLP